MTQSTIAAEVLGRLTAVLVEDFDVPPDDVHGSAHLINDLGLDSIDLLSAVSVLEERFGIVVPDSELPEMLQVDACVARVVARLENTA